MNEKEVERVESGSDRSFFLDCFSALASGAALLAAGFVIGAAYYATQKNMAPAVKTEQLILQEYKNESVSDDEVKPRLLQKTPNILDKKKERNHEAGEIEFLKDKNAYVFYNEDGFTVCYTLDKIEGNGVQLKAFVESKEETENE